MLEEIKKEVEQLTGVSIDRKNRGYANVEARALFAQRAFKETDLKDKEIAKFLGMGKSATNYYKNHYQNYKQ